MLGPKNIFTGSVRIIRNIGINTKRQHGPFNFVLTVLDCTKFAYNTSLLSSAAFERLFSSRRNIFRASLLQTLSPSFLKAIFRKFLEFEHFTCILIRDSNTHPQVLESLTSCSSCIRIMIYRVGT